MPLTEADQWVPICKTQICIFLKMLLIFAGKKSQSCFLDLLRGYCYRGLSSSPMGICKSNCAQNQSKGNYLVDGKLLEGKTVMQTLLQHHEWHFFFCIFHAKNDEKKSANSFYRIVFWTVSGSISNTSNKTKNQTKTQTKKQEKYWHNIWHYKFLCWKGLIWFRFCHTIIVTITS